MAADEIIDASKMDWYALLKLKDTRAFEYVDFSFLEIVKIGSLFPKKNKYGQRVLLSHAHLLHLP
jgi:hypothetical protein